MRLASYDVYSFESRELRVNDDDFEADITKYVGNFLIDYLNDFIWKDKENPPGHYGQEVSAK